MKVRGGEVEGAYECKRGAGVEGEKEIDGGGVHINARRGGGGRKYKGRKEIDGEWGAYQCKRGGDKVKGEGR